MGRRPKNEPKGAPSDSRLTPKQFDLLAGFLIAGYQGDEYVGFIWSPKNVLARSPTRGESSSLSTRLKKLTERGFVKRYGRELFVTEQGRARLRVDAREGAAAGKLVYLGVLAFLEALEAKSQKEALLTSIQIISEGSLPLEEKASITQALKSAAEDKERKEFGGRGIYYSVVTKYKNKDATKN